MKKMTINELNNSIFEILIEESDLLKKTGIIQYCKVLIILLTKLIETSTNEANAETETQPLIVKIKTIKISK